MLAATIREIDLDALERFLAEGKGMLVDVLPPEHSQGRHIPGAANACVHQVSFLEVMAGLCPDKARPVVVYGAGEGSLDAKVAADKLLRAGYTDVAVFSGGLGQYAAAGRSLEGKSPDAFEPPHPIFTPEPRAYALVPEKSVITWFGRNHNVTHHGELPVTSGGLDMAGPVTGSFAIKLSGIRNRNLEGDPLRGVLEAHLASDDFFFTALYPTATYSVASIQPLPGASATSPGHLVRGELTLRGVTRKLSFPAHLHMLEAGRIGLQANFDFDRTKWGIIYGSARYFKHLGMHLVFDLISVDLRLVLE